MKQIYLLAGLLFAGTIHSQYCMTGGPSSTVDSNVQLVRIVGQGDSIHFVGCPGVIGVQNLTNLSVTLNANSTYPLSVQYGTCNGNYLGSGEVWIDYDQSGSFDPWESVGTWTGTPPVPLSVFSITVPGSAQNGTTRMRVMQREGNLVPPLDPCGAYSWGSVMDFSVNITGGIDCSAYPGDDISDAIPVTAIPYTHNWDNSYCYGNQNYAYPSPDVFYLVRPSAQSASIRVSTCGSTFDTFVTILDANGNAISYNDDGPSCPPQSEITIPTIGVDTLYVVVEGWGSLMGAYTLHIYEDFVGIEEIDASRFAIYPNPAAEAFRVNNALNSEITVTDLSGKTVQRICRYDGQAIPVSGLAAGAYFVSVNYQGRIFTQKLIVAE